MKKNYFFLILFLLLAGIFHVQQAQAQNVARAYNSSGNTARASARTTIQAAVNDAQSGDLIRILANVSTTSEVTINKSLTFRSGSNYGNSNTNRTVSNHTFIITDPNVTLTMRDRTGASGRIILDNSTITTNIPDYYVVSANATGSNSNTNYTVRNEVARVGNTYYATVQAAVDAATNGGTVIIQRSDSPADVENVTINKTLTFTTRDDGDFALSNYNIIISAAGATVTTNNHIDISSSTVTTDLPGYYVVSATSGSNTTYSVSNQVAFIGTTPYTSLEAAVTAAVSGDVIEVQTNLTAATTQDITVGDKSITIASKSGSNFSLSNFNFILTEATSSLALNSSLTLASDVQITTNVAGYHVENATSGDNTVYTISNKVARIGETYFTSLDAAIDAVQAGETIEIIADSVGITNTKVIPANVTITGQGKTATKMTIISSSGSGITINNSGVILKDMHIDGSQITSGDYKTLVNVRADNVLIDNVVMTGGGRSTWNSSILVETLSSSQTFTVSNSTISGSFRGVLRESCNANIVITNCDIDAVYPFNIDGGNGGTVTVTGGSLRGWTSYGGLEKVSFTDVDFGKGTAGYAYLKPYVNTEIIGSSFSSDFGVDPKIAPTIFFNDCELAGDPLTSNNIDNLLDGATQEDQISHAVVVNSGYSTNDNDEITAGIYGGNLVTLNNMCADGYRGIPLNTEPETYRVTPVYFIHFNANGGTGTMEDSYIERTSSTFTVPTCSITNAPYIFKAWNTKADGTGDTYTVGATLTGITSDTTLYAQWQGVARIGETDFTSLDAAIDAVQAGQTIEIIADSVGITNTKVIPANVTITGQGKTATKMTIISSSGSGITINNSGVILKDMHIDGSQITSGDYKTLVNVRADNVLIDNVVMTGGGRSTWNSSILVETLSSSQTFTVSNSTISGSFRGVLRESCNANIVITNCDIDAVYPFNIDGGNGGTVTVTGGSLRGWTSYGGLEKVSFTDVDFGKGTAGYAYLKPYVNTEIIGSSFSSDFGVDPKIAPTIFFNDCELAGDPLTSNNIDNLLDGATQEDQISHAVVVNGGYSTNDNDEITGGIYGGNPEVLSTMIASGYAAFPLNTVPQTYQVDPAYFIHFNAAGGTGTHGDSIVRRTSPTFTVPANTEFTYGSYGFLNWNSKPYGAGMDIAVGSTMTLSSDTTLYAEWNIDFVAKIGDNTYPTIQAAVDYANENLTGDVTIDLVKSTSEVVKVLQKADNNLIIEGNGTTLTGQMHISACDANCTCGDIYYGTDSIAIRNLNFSYNPDFFEPQTNAGQSIDGEGFIFFSKRTFSPTCNTNYSHNISIRNCNFDGTGFNSENPAYGIYAVSTLGGSVDRFILDHCTVTNALGLAELQSIQHFTVTGNTATNVTRGLTIYNSALSPHTISNNHFTATEAAFYINYNDNGVVINMAENEVSAPTAFLFGSDNAGSACNLDITSGTYIGDIVNNTESNIDFFDISGGTYSNNVTGDPCAEGYAAFANGTDPETWTVTKAWFLRYNANGGTGTMDSAFVKQSDDAAGRTVIVADCNYTYDSYAFAEWNTKADGTGTRVAPGAQFTLTQDTVLYAQWARVKNVTQDKYYNTLQAAINDATAGDSLLVLTDLTIDNPSDNVSITIAKNLIINGNEYKVTCKDARALAITTGNVNVTLRKLNIIAGYEGSGSDAYGVRGFQVNSVDNVNLVMDSCRLTGTFGANGKPIPYYGLNMVGGANHKLTISNSYLWGRAALNNFANDSKYTFINDTLYGINVEGVPEGQLEAFATIVLDGNVLSVNPANCSKRDSVKLINCVVIAERQAYYDEQWIRIQYGAANNDVYADENTKFIDIDATTYEPMSNVYIATNYATISNEMGTGNSIRMYNLSTGAIDTLRAYQHTVAGPDENGVYRVSHSIIYNHNYQSKHSDLDYPFVYGTLSNGDKLYLRENFTMMRNDTADINGQFELNFKYNSQYYDITQGDYSIVLREGSSCKTDKQVTSLFTSPDGDVIETQSGSAYLGYTYTYTVAPYIAYNVNRDIKYSVLQTAVDEVNNGDTVRILRNISLANGENVNITKTLTLDLNGDTLSIEQLNNTTVKEWFATLKVDGGNLTIKDGGEHGVLMATGKGSAVWVTNNGNLTLNSGTICGNNNGIYIGTDHDLVNGTATINGGLVTTIGRSPGYAVYNKGTQVTINGGTIIGDTTIYSGYGVFGFGSNSYGQSNTAINGGYFRARYVIYNAGGQVTIEDGTFVSGVGTSGNCAQNSSNSTMTINGGTYYLSGTSGFRNDNATANLTLNGGTLVDRGIRQSTIYNKGILTLNNIDVPCEHGESNIELQGGTTTINGGSITYTNASYSYANACIYTPYGNYTSTLNINGATLEGLVNSKTLGIWTSIDPDDTDYPQINLTMTSGSIRTKNYCIVNNGTYSTSTSKWVIEGGTLESTESVAIYHAAPDSLIIGTADGTGPVITGVKSAIEHRAGHLVVKGGTLTASADHYSCVSETSGTTTTGAAVAVSQHTTNRPTTVAINGGTLNGIAALSVANPETTYNDGSNVSATINGGTFNGMIVNDLALTINDGNFNLETISSGDVIFLHRSGAATIPATSTNIVNDGVFTVTAPNASSVKFDGTGMSTTVNNGWYSESLTAVTRGVKRNLAGDGDIAYAYNARLVPVDTASVTAAGLTGNYWQLGNFITYHSNDGRDSIIEVSKPIDQTITLLDGMAFAKLGHDMIYWNTEPDRTGVDYALGATSPSDNADLNLYAIWLLRECPEARDADGNVYATVRLGARYTCWMAENLRTTHYSDGRAVANPMALPAYMTPDYPDDDVRDSIFGLLYDWYDAVDTASNDVDSVAVVFNAGGRVHGICPQGWYVPSDRDFAELEPYGGFALRSESYWITQTGNNSTAFNAIPAGYYNCNTGRYENTFGYAVFQTCHPVYDMVSGSFIDYVCDNLIKKLELLPCSGFSVRCVLNDD